MLKTSTEGERRLKIQRKYSIGSDTGFSKFIPTVKIWREKNVNHKFQQQLFDCVTNHFCEEH